MAVLDLYLRKEAGQVVEPSEPPCSALQEVAQGHPVIAFFLCLQMECKPLPKIATGIADHVVDFYHNTHRLSVVAG